MHGLVNRAFQSFLRDTFGAALWDRVALAAGADAQGFEAMLVYDAALTDAVIDAASRALRRPRAAVLEDFGHYLVSHPHLEPLRRLLRFSGSSYADFLSGLEDMRDRACLAVPDLDLPDLTLAEDGPDSFVLRCAAPIADAGHVYLGLLRAMADDYGALVFLDHLGLQDGAEVIAIRLVAARHAEGRRFDLSPRVD
jgi:hypothetical protein